MFEFKPLKGGMHSNHLLGGDLNPVSGFPFPLLSMLLPWQSANRVENAGRQWKQNCCKLLQVYVHFLCWLYLPKLIFRYLPFVEFSLYVAGAGADSRISSAIPARTFRAINPQVEPLELDQDRPSRFHLASLSARFCSSSASYIANSVSEPPVAAV